MKVLARSPGCQASLCAVANEGTSFIRRRNTRTVLKIRHVAIEEGERTTLVFTHVDDAVVNEGTIAKSCQSVSQSVSQPVSQSVTPRRVTR